MGKYDPIWRTLKEKGSVSLAIAKPLQARVIKGTIHAKDHDLLYKIELDEKKRWAKIEYVQEQSRVTISLKVYIQTKELTTEDF
jgi:hypothetical protein